MGKATLLHPLKVFIIFNLLSTVWKSLVFIFASLLSSQRTMGNHASDSAYLAGNVRLPLFSAIYSRMFTW